MERGWAEFGAVSEATVFLDYFKDLPDPRQRGKIIYPLVEVLLLCLLAVLGGAETLARQRLVLGQIKVAEKSNEIVAIPALLDMMAIEGAIVTIDAMGCQRDIAQKILDKKADYVPALKGNQATLCEDVEVLVAEQKANGFKDTKVSRHETVDGDHGRIETRTYTAIHDQPESLVQIKLGDEAEQILKAADLKVLPCVTTPRSLLRMAWSIITQIHSLAASILIRVGIVSDEGFSGVRIGSEEENRVSTADLEHVKHQIVNFANDDCVLLRSFKPAKRFHLACGTAPLRRRAHSVLGDPIHVADGFELVDA
jgi:predicted transposase YbfD/YdcC